MTAVSFPNSPLRLEKSSLSPSAHVDTPKTIQTHFETSSLAPSSQTETINASKPQLPKSYQTLLVNHALQLEALQGRLLTFDTHQIKEVEKKTKTVFSELLKVNEHARAREINASKWRTVSVGMSAVVMVAAVAAFATAALPAAIAAALPAGLVALVPLLQANFQAQKYVNDAYLLKTKAEQNRLDHELNKGKHEHKRLTQNSGTNAFSQIEEQIYVLATTLDKLLIN